MELTGIQEHMPQLTLSGLVTNTLESKLSSVLFRGVFNRNIALTLKTSSISLKSGMLVLRIEYPQNYVIAMLLC